MPAVRGFRLTSHTFEQDTHVVPLPTTPNSYHCPMGHVTTLAFAADADEIPSTWDCPKCGRLAHRDETAGRRGPVGLVSPRTAVASKTHLDMLKERRSLAELEAVLAERLAILRAREAEAADAAQTQQA